MWRSFHEGMIFECEELAGKDAELEDGPHDGQMPHEDKASCQVPRLPCDAEATKSHGSDAAARVRRHPDLPVRGAMAVRARDQLVVWQTHGEGCAQCINVVGLVVQKAVGQSRMDARRQCVATAPDGRHGDQTRRAGFVEAGKDGQAAGLPQ